MRADYGNHKVPNWRRIVEFLCLAECRSIFGVAFECGEVQPVSFAGIDCFVFLDLIE